MDRSTHLLLVLFVDRVQRVFDGHTLEVAGGDFETQGEVEVYPFDGRGAEEFLEDFGFAEGGRGGVKFPVQ